MDSMKQRVALFISCRNLKNLDVASKSDPQVEVYVKDRSNPNWLLIGRTEVANNNLNPDFSTPIESEYYFEREQNLRIMVYDIDSTTTKEFIGKAETTMGRIIGSPKQTFVTDLLTEKTTKTRGKLVIRLDNVNSSNDEVRIKLNAKLVPQSNLCCAAPNNPYYVLSRARGQESKEEFVRVFKSPNLVNNTAPMFNPCKLKLAMLCNGDKDLPIKFSFYSMEENGNDKFYGEVITTVTKIVNGEKTL